MASVWKHTALEGGNEGRKVPAGSVGHSQSTSRSGGLELQSRGSQGSAEGEALLEVGCVLTLPQET